MVEKQGERIFLNEKTLFTLFTQERSNDQFDLQTSLQKGLNRLYFIQQKCKPICSVSTMMSYVYLCPINDLFNVELQSTVDKLLRDTNLASVIGTHSWKEQFIEAFTVSAGQWLLCSYVVMCSYYIHCFCGSMKLRVLIRGIIMEIEINIKENFLFPIFETLCWIHV